MSSLYPSVKLYRETPCEHGYVDGHGPYVGDDLIGCLGGSREEVTIDYAAAWAVMRAAGCSPKDGLVPAVLDAAFKSAGFTKTFTSEKEH